MVDQPTSPTILGQLRDLSNATAWRRFADEYGDLIIRFCMTRHLQRADAEDIRQQTIVQLMKAIPAFDDDRARGRFRDYRLRVVRLDVYAMGVVLYRTLTGREPYQGTTLATVFDQIRRGRPALPESLNPAVNRELSAIVQMAMRPDRAGRYPTMSDLSDDLGRWLDRRAVRAHRHPTATA